MMSYDKYERGRQHLNGGHQRITYKKKRKKKVNIYPKAYQSNQWVGVDHTAQIHPMTSSVDKNKMKVVMTMMI